MKLPPTSSSFPCPALAGQGRVHAQLIQSCTCAHHRLAARGACVASAQHMHSSQSVGEAGCERYARSSAEAVHTLFTTGQESQLQRMHARLQPSCTCTPLRVHLKLHVLSTEVTHECFTVGWRSWLRRVHAQLQLGCACVFHSQLMRRAHAQLYLGHTCTLHSFPVRLRRGMGGHACHGAKSTLHTPHMDNNTD